MNEISNRLKDVVTFLMKNGYAKSDAELARKLGYPRSTFCMSVNGTRVPTWELLLKICDQFPINFWWLRSGEGSMIREDKTAGLLMRIAELEKRVKELESSLK